MFQKRWAKLFLIIALCSSLAVLVSHSAQQKAYALPLFARRLGVSCSTCHTSPPRLNETGYRFRAAGYRMPEEIGKGSENKPFKFTDYSGIRLQARFDATRFRTGQDDDDHDVRFNLFAAEFYTLYGPWGGNLSSNLKVTIYPEESHDTEDHLRVEGNLKLTLGNDKRFFEIRGGVPHPMEGYGASDVAITNTRPYFQENPANFNQSTVFTPWNFHQAAVTLGYYQGRNSVRALILEGVRLHDDGNPFGRKEPFTDSPFSHHPKPDFQLMANRILHSNAGSVTLYYYHGNLTLPVLGTDGGAFQNNFDRVALYGSYPIKKVILFGGVQRGRDDLVTGGRFTSLGAYGEATVPVFNDITHAGVRYDWFDPARRKSDNEIRGLTAYINAWYRDQFRFVVEYQRRNQQRGLLADKNDNAFQVRLIYVK